MLEGARRLLLLPLPFSATRRCEGSPVVLGLCSLFGFGGSSGTRSQPSCPLPSFPCSAQLPARGGCPVNACFVSDGCGPAAPPDWWGDGEQHWPLQGHGRALCTLTFAGQTSHPASGPLKLPCFERGLPGKLRTCLGPCSRLLACVSADVSAIP